LEGQGLQSGQAHRGLECDQNSYSNSVVHRSVEASAQAQTDGRALERSL